MLLFQEDCLQSNKDMMYIYKNTSCNFLSTFSQRKALPAWHRTNKYAHSSSRLFALYLELSCCFHLFHVVLKKSLGLNIYFSMAFFLSFSEKNLLIR